MGHHTESVFVMNKLVRVLGEKYIRVLKNRFLEVGEKRLDLEGFREAIQFTFTEWGRDRVKEGNHYNDGIESAEKTLIDKQVGVVSKDFTNRRLTNLFTQLDCDSDSLIDWMDVSTFIVESAAIKQTIKQFQEKPQARDWEGRDVDKIIYVEPWRKLVLCTQSKVVYIHTTTGVLYAELHGHKSSVMHAAYLTAIARLATTSSDSTIIIWDEKQRSILKRIPFPQPIFCLTSVRLDNGAFLYVAGLERNIKGYNIDNLMTWTPTERHLQDDRHVVGEEEQVIKKVGKTNRNTAVKQQANISETTSEHETISSIAPEISIEEKIIITDDHTPVQDSLTVLENSDDVTSTAVADPQIGESQSDCEINNSPDNTNQDDVITVDQKQDECSTPGSATGRYKTRLTLTGSDDEKLPPQKDARTSQRTRRREDLLTAGWSDPRKYPTPCVRFALGHEDWITELLVISDLRLIVSASLDKTVRVWDLSTGEHRYKKIGHTKGVLSLCYVEEYRVLLSSGHGKEVLVWNPFTASGSLATLAGHDKQVLGVCNFPNTPTCLSMDVTGRVITWDVRSYSPIQTLGGPLSKYLPGPVACYCLDSNDGVLISIGKVISWYKAKSNIHIHKMKQPISHILLGHKKQIIVLASGSKLYTYSSLDGRLILAQERLSSSEVTGLCWCDNDCARVAVGNEDGRIKITSTDTGAVLGTFRTSSSSGVRAIYRLKKATDSDRRRITSQRTESKHLMIVSQKGQISVINHLRISNERPILRHQALTGGTSKPDWQVYLSCYSIGNGIVYLFGEHNDDSSQLCLEAWDMKHLEEPLFYGKLNSKVTACCTLDNRNCLLSCCKKGILYIYNGVNVALMLKLTLDLVSQVDEKQTDEHTELVPFVATSLGFNETELAIIATDHKRVKTISFTWLACSFFEIHKDANWNLVSVPDNQTLYRKRYIIEKTVRGSSNEVHLGVDLRLNKRVALKTVTDLQEYQTEVELCQALLKYGSESVTRLFEFWTDPLPLGTAHLVFECGGRTLWDAIFHSELTAENLRSMVEGLNNGLHEIHSVGYAHCDIKPKNVVEFGEAWKIIDLDTSCKLGNLLPLRFTPGYCPPEMARKRTRGESLPATSFYDMWCFGIIILECLTQSRVFPETATCDNIVEILNSPTADIDNYLSSKIAHAMTLDVALGSIVSNLLVVEPSERKTAKWCVEYLTDQGYLTNTNTAPQELRPFPKTVPIGIPILEMNESSYEGGGTFFRTVLTPCSQITFVSLNENPGAIIIADFDTYTHQATLRAYSLRIEYHGRLPTNDYDDTDINWHFPLVREQPPDKETESLEKDKPDEEPWVSHTPTALLKTFSWTTLRKKMEDLSIKQNEDGDIKVPVQLSIDISPFFSEWKKTGIIYKPVVPFYRKDNEEKLVGIKQQRLPQIRKRPVEKTEPTKDLRDIDFIRSFPKQVDSDVKPQHNVKQVAPRERCSCGASIVGQHLEDVHRSVSVRIVNKEGCLSDSSLWVQPPRKTLTSLRGTTPKWVSDMDTLLGLSLMTQCPKGHPLKTRKAYTQFETCFTCGERVKCCTRMSYCTQCSYKLCPQCGQSGKRPKTKSSAAHL